MVVAKKEFEMYDFKKTSPEKNKKNKKPNKNNTHIKLKLFLYSTLVLTIAIVVLLRFAHISKLQYDLSKVQTEVTELQKEKQSISIDLAKAKDSRWIEVVAMNALSMNYPNENQKVYVDLNKKD
ncbi:hypothetical protein [Senegalia sp. (in: firmicutes)]|uniref:hypothetical protein n=1 Tax=Senegalia sp. (in: firmicutes) TaxID=1924098 RepID=UPI003F9B5E5D